MTGKSFEVTTEKPPIFSGTLAREDREKIKAEALAHWRGQKDGKLFMAISSFAVLRLISEIETNDALLNTPELIDFPKAVHLEAAHQRLRWPKGHDEKKTLLDWFWLIGYLAQKAVYSFLAGDDKKGLHHIITTAAALNNWHSHMLELARAKAGTVAPTGIQGDDYLESL